DRLVGLDQPQACRRRAAVASGGTDWFAVAGYREWCPDAFALIREFPQLSKRRTGRVEGRLRRERNRLRSDANPTGRISGQAPSRVPIGRILGALFTAHQ